MAPVSPLSGILGHGAGGLVSMYRAALLHIIDHENVVAQVGTHLILTVNVAGTQNPNN